MGIADELGFRVGATNLPVHNVDAAPVAVASASAPVAVAAAAPVTAPVAQVSVAAAAPAPVTAPVVAAYAQAVPPVAAPIPVTQVANDVANSQYHAQDDIGQFNYGYSNPLSSKQELKTADGVTRGSYSYVDANGIVQTVNYLSDALGFRVAATNLPVHHVEDAPVVAAEPTVAEPVQQVVVEAKTQPQVIAPSVNYAYLPYAHNYAYEAQPIVQVAQTPAVAAPVVASPPVAAPVAPVAAVAPVVVAPEGSQYHAQDDAGQYTFGYADGNSVKQEVKTADGTVRGAYSYVDSDGIVQTVNYIADDLGFRVGATNLPVHNVDAAPVAVASAPVAVAAAPVVAAAAPVTAPVAQVAPVTAPVAQVAVAAAAPVTAPVVAAYAQAAPVVATYASDYSYAVPAPAVAPVAAPIPVTQVANDVANSQYHAQDDIGQFNYGYSNPLSSKQELKTADGVTRGSYSYVDANGIVQTV